VLTYTQTIILPFSIDGTIYVVQDEQGKAIGTGSREVCAALLTFVNRDRTLDPAESSSKRTRAEVRSAIVF